MHQRPSFAILRNVVMTVSGFAEPVEDDGRGPMSFLHVKNEHCRTSFQRRLNPSKDVNRGAAIDSQRNAWGAITYNKIDRSMLEQRQPQ